MDERNEKAKAKAIFLSKGRRFSLSSYSPESRSIMDVVVDVDLECIITTGGESHKS